MNLQSLSDRYIVTTTEAQDAPDYALGKPRRVTEKPAAEPERWIATGTPGYVKSTTTGAIRTNDGPLPVYSQKAPPWGPLIEPDEDYGACCVPSHGDLVEAAFAFLDRTGKQHWCVTETIPGLEYVGSIYEEIPADKRAAVIAALNALGA